MEVQELFSKFSNAAITFVSGQVEVRMLHDGQAVVTFSRGWADLDILTIRQTAEEFGAKVSQYGRSGLKFGDLESALAILELTI